MLLIQSTSSRPRIELSTLARSGNGAVGIQIDCRVTSVGLMAHARLFYKEDERSGAVREQGL
jgi:hypothetical protein